MEGLYSQIVLFGDSLMEMATNTQDGFCFQGELQSAFIRRFDVVNRGFSGYNTRNIVKYMENIFPDVTQQTPRIRFLVILLGANDASLSVPTNRQHVPIDEYKKNLQIIINHPRITAHAPRILLVAPPPVNELKTQQLDTAEGHAGAIRTSAVSASYSQKAREVASENENVVLIDLWKGIMDKAISMSPEAYLKGGPWLGSPENGKAGGLEQLLPDGLHMSGDAYRVLFDLLMKHFDGAEQEYVLPEWKRINPPNLPAK